MICPRHPGVERPDIRLSGIAPHNRLDVVIAITGGKRAHDAEEVRPCRQLRQRAAERHSGECCLHLSRRTANSGRGGHLRIERFDLTGATVQEDENDRLACQDGTGWSRQRLLREQVRKCAAAQPERAHSQEGTPRGAISRIKEREHERNDFRSGTLRATTPK